MDRDFILQWPKNWNFNPLLLTVEHLEEEVKQRWKDGKPGGARRIHCAPNPRSIGLGGARITIHQQLRPRPGKWAEALPPDRPFEPCISVEDQREYRIETKIFFDINSPETHLAVAERVRHIWRSWDTPDAWFYEI